MIEQLQQENIARVTRRQLFGKTACGIGVAALAALLKTGGASASHPAVPPTRDRRSPDIGGLPHHVPKAKRVIVFWQGGGPSHVDLFDEKPKLQELAGENVPDSIRGSTRLSTMSSNYSKWPCVPSIKPHKNWGQCGMRMSQMLPGAGSLADDICLIRSLHTEAVNHAPGVTLFFDRLPGAWSPEHGRMDVLRTWQRIG